MLPVHRVVGHKEYGNTPPGGWPGRKTDPTYSMNWRRQRVADFKPRGGATTQEDDMTPEQSKQLEALYERVVTQQLTRAIPGSDQTATLATLVRWADGNASQARGEIAATRREVAAVRESLVELAKLAGKGGGASAEEIEAAVDRAFARNVDRVEVRFVDAADDDGPSAA